MIDDSNIFDVSIEMKLIQTEFNQLNLLLHISIQIQAIKIIMRLYCIARYR